MKATIFTAVICTAVINLISPASAQYYGQTSYYGPASMHYHYLSPAGACCALVTAIRLGLHTQSASRRCRTLSGLANARRHARMRA
jgi:hypothetical protein